MNIPQRYRQLTSILSGKTKSSEEKTTIQGTSGLEYEFMCHTASGSKFPADRVKELILLHPWTISHVHPSFTWMEDDDVEVVRVRFKSVNKLESREVEEQIRKLLK